VIRLAAAEEAETLTALINLAFRAERFFATGERIDLDEVREHFSTGVFLVAEESGAIDGCVYVEIRSDRGYFGLLSVDPARQGAGIGSRLVTSAEDYCRERACRVMDLEVVNLRAELPPFYERRGYSGTTTAPFPSNVETTLPCHFICMSKPLNA